MILQFRTLSLAFLAVTLSPLVFAQHAQVQGQVTDSSGGVIVKAQIRVVDQQTGVERKGETNESGQYSVPGLDPSTYKVFVDAHGFSSVVSSPITLTVAQNAVLDFRLQVGTTSEVITVKASDSDLSVNTTDASVSTVIDQQFVENLPLNGRSFQTLLYITPGVLPNAAAQSYAAQGQFVFDGQRGDASYWMVDGVSANIGMYPNSPGPGVGGGLGGSNAVGGTSALVSVDALQEFRIESSTYSPEFGRMPGGQVSIQTRSGTNQFHGSLFEYLRNGVLDATDWFATHYGLAKPQEIQNDFGGVVGGPIRKNKSFFFFSAETFRLRLPTTYLGDVPDLAARQAATPEIRPYINVFPLPAPGVADVGPGYAPYSATFSSPATADAYSLRIDHQLSSKINLFARYNHAPSNVAQRGVFGSAANNVFVFNEITKTATVGATWAASPHLLNDLRFNYSVSGGRAYYYTDTFGGGTPFPSASATGFPSEFSYHNGYVYLGTLFGNSMNENVGSTGADFQHQYNLVNTISVEKNKHNLKLGIDYRRLSPNLLFFAYSQQTLFDNMADFSAGNSLATYVIVGPQMTLLLHDLGVFAQDSWRLNSRFNLTYGLRWDGSFAPTSEPSLPGLTGFSTTDLSNLALAPAGTPPYKSRYGNVAPRIGGAYRLSTNPDWGLVLRGGFGVYYGLASTEIYNINAGSGYYPFLGYNLLSDVSFPLSPANTAPPAIQPPNAQNGATLAGFDPNLNSPYALEWNTALEQSLGKAQTLAVSYVAASDKHLLLAEFVNNPNPNYASAYLVGNLGSLSYQSLQARFLRRMSNGLQAQASYTWSHSIDTGSYGAYSNGSFADPNSNRGDSDYDIRHALSAALTYEIPELKKNLLTRAITGGWATDNTVQILSGPPVDVQDANYTAIFQATPQVKIRPDVVPGQPEYLTGPQYPGGKALNFSSFTDPPIDPTSGLPLRQGDLGRNARRSLGLKQWDMVVRRDFPLHESVKLQFRAELFNIVNHPNFGPFNNQFQTGNNLFGQATKMENQALGGGQGAGTQNPLYTPGGPRSIELALKLLF